MFSITASTAPTARGVVFRRQQNPSRLTFGQSLCGKPLAAITQSKVAREHSSFFVHAGKMKTRKAAAKRYKVTASGKVRRVIRYHVVSSEDGNRPQVARTL